MADDEGQRLLDDAQLRATLTAIDQTCLAAAAAAASADVAARAAAQAAQAAVTAAGRTLPEQLRQLRVMLGLPEDVTPWPPVPDASQL